MFYNMEPRRNRPANHIQDEHNPLTNLEVDTLMPYPTTSTSDITKPDSTLSRWSTLSPPISYETFKALVQSNAHSLIYQQLLFFHHTSHTELSHHPMPRRHHVRTLTQSLHQCLFLLLHFQLLLARNL